MPKVSKVMDNKEFAKELEKRTREFAVGIIRLSRTLPNTPEGRVRDCHPFLSLKIGGCTK